MNYERFSELWDALVANRPRTTNTNASEMTEEMTNETKLALIDYANGNKAKINSVREFLNRSAV